MILATNVDLAQLVAEQKFRQDLYYRINVLNVKLPPLRDRLSDIPLVAHHFLRRFTQESAQGDPGIHRCGAMAALAAVSSGRAMCVSLENAD